MPSFDIVSEIDKPEVQNAIENAQRELQTRFDFRGVEASFEWVDPEAVLKAEGNHQLSQMRDMLIVKLVKRGIDPKMMNPGDVQHSGKTFNLRIGFKEGIEQPIAKKIIKLLKDKKVKVQAAIQGEQLRVTGKKRDDLQAAIALVKAEDLGQPFQYKNFRD